MKRIAMGVICVSLLMSACSSKKAGLESDAGNFLDGLQGVWQKQTEKNDGDTVRFVSDGKVLHGIVFLGDEDVQHWEITPTAPVDAANNQQSVKLSIKSLFPIGAYVVCDQVVKTGTAYGKPLKGAKEFEEFKSVCKTTEDSTNVVIRNISVIKDRFQPALIADDGATVGLSFIRTLSAEESQNIRTKAGSFQERSMQAQKKFDEYISHPPEVESDGAAAAAPPSAAAPAAEALPEN